MRNSVIFKAAVVLAAGFLLTTGVAHGEPIFAASFEASEGFRPGKLEGQQGWSLYGANINEAIITPIKGTIPESFSVKITRGNAFLHRTLTEETLPNPVKFSIRLRLDPQGEEAGEAAKCRVFLSNASPKRRHSGVSFGIDEQNGELIAHYRDENQRIPIPGQSALSPGIFYRFEVTLHPEAKTFEIQLFEEGVPTPLGEIKGARFRDEQITINHLMLNGTPGAYFDDIAINGPA